MFTYNGVTYVVEKRKANIGELVLTTAYLSEDYPDGSIFKVHDYIEELNEVVVYPSWYEKGMDCFGYLAWLTEDDYEVLTPLK